MITFLIPLALFAGTAHGQRDNEVECLRNLKAVFISVEIRDEKHGVPSVEDLKLSIELELRSKNIPIVTEAESFKAFENGLTRGEPDLRPGLFLNIGSVVVGESGVCVDVGIKSLLFVSSLPHNPNASAPVMLWEGAHLMFLPRRDPSAVERAVLSLVKKFELKWLKAHEPKSVDKNRISTALTLRPVI